MECNLVVLAGSLAVDPEERVFESGARLVRYLVTIRSPAPRRRIDVVPVTLWDPESHHLDPSLTRGSRVMVVGMVQRRFWQSTEGRQSRVEVVAHQVELQSRGALDVADVSGDGGVAVCG